MIEAMSIANALSHAKATTYVRTSPSYHDSYTKHLETSLVDTPVDELSESRQRKSFLVSPSVVNSVSTGIATL